MKGGWKEKRKEGRREGGEGRMEGGIVCSTVEAHVTEFDKGPIWW